MLRFVDRLFPNGFRKSDRGQTIPRVRFEAISVGSALALRDGPGLSIDPNVVEARMAARQFDERVVSDGANVRSKPCLSG
jgi:hypothetical protein